MSASTGKAVGAGTMAWLIAALIFAAVVYFSVGPDVSDESPVVTCHSLGATPGEPDVERVACS